MCGGRVWDWIEKEKKKTDKQMFFKNILKKYTVYYD